MPAVDSFSRFQTQDFSPLTRAASVTPHNTNELGFVTRALYVGGAGDVAVTMQDSGEVTFVDVPAGTVLPIRVKVVKSTGTDATSIIALW
ncbi:MAG: hypothetical protein EBT75_01395 [Proteobacteria bacterium]|nr:hypothetical protein [Pseudomonadota bacterium]NBS49283.1 hypothetical protein [Verrucomicrobiota bacterium]